MFVPGMEEQTGTAVFASILLPYLVGSVAAGFPSPAADYQEERLDLAEILVQHPAATFLIRAKGDSMRDSGILDGDLLVVDRAVRPVSGHIVLASIGGQHTVKRLRRQGRRVFLDAANPEFPSIEITGEEELRIWGVVAHAIHHLLRS